MEFASAVRARRMVRAYADTPVVPELVDDLLDLARRSPSAGHTQGWAFLVLDTPADVARFWDLTMPDPAVRAGFAFPGLFDAPVVIVPWASPAAYVSRYAEPDKARTGLGDSTDRWPVPYWFVDTAFATQTLLLAAADAGLGALFFGLFTNEAAVRDGFAVPDGWRALGALTLGWPAPDRPGASSTRGRRPLTEVVHRGRWGAGA